MTFLVGSFFLAVSGLFALAAGFDGIGIWFLGSSIISFLIGWVLIIKGLEDSID